MKTKFFVSEALISLILLMSILFFSCEKMPTEVLLKSNSTVIPGDLKDYLEVVDGNYKYEYLKDRDNGILTIKIKALKKLNLEKQDIEFIVGEYLDESGVPISGLPKFHICNGNDNIEEIKNLLKEGKGEIFLKTVWYYSFEKKISKIIFQKAKAFMITNSKLKETKSETSSNNNNNNNNEKLEVKLESSSDTNWDSILDDYEKFVDKYVDVYKKIKADPTDMSALTESTTMMQKCLSLQEKLNNASSELSVSQAARLTQIATKMATSIY